MTRTCPAIPNQATLPLLDDRSAAWKIIHDAGDVAVSEDGTYFLIGADAVESAAKNTEVFSSEGAFALLGSPFPLVPIAVDPPEHSRYRRVLNKFFSPRSMAEHEDELRRQVDELIDGIMASGPVCDVVSALAVPFPSQVFLTLFGLPLKDRDRLIGWKNAIIELTDTHAVAESTPESLLVAGELLSYLADLIKQRRVAARGVDLLSQLLADRDEGAITDDELMGMCFIFILAGLDTVTSAVGFALSALAQDADLRNKVRSDAAVAAAFMEEILRVESPVPSVPRVTTAAVDVDGVTIPAGATCWLMMGAANRDARRFEDPHLIGERRTGHFAFGRGPHRCLGSHLALLELRLVIEQWLTRIPDFALESPPEVIWPSATHGLRRLEIRIDV
ncbi:cytochrome P450 [Mycolicibacterium hodleri]|uniref:Cytochrome P450 n=1 Tax=Mycolicibacterium hodleri TaxID=49897 RepID=A0A502E655_9MYCO|nr:cytochrome P450 [Mycolicibacterium hodleri]TPG32439.1 cytochrome P450 [Mycolicibacterium hodleri]